ncbi:MAG TPA: serine hydrolase [Xanthomonadales bacterium]|nr:serine hydrolase [Xanthomonadales bacterium]
MKKKRRLFKKNKPLTKKAKEKPVIPAKLSPKRYSVLKNINKHESSLLTLLIPLLLVVIYFTISYLNTYISKNIKVNKLTDSLSGKMLPFPQVNESYIPYLSARAAIVVGADNQAVIFSKNPNLRFSMASTAKVMTALVALEHYKMDSVLTIKSRGVPGSTIGLQNGEKFYFEDLLYAMLLPSANDAAVAIVDNYPGGKAEFVKKMNEKAKALHLKNTSFSDPAGLDDDGNFTTVDDLARLGGAAMQNQKLSEVVGTPYKLITNQSRSKQYSLGNLNRLLGVNGVNGIKTGTTEGAGEVLVTSSKQNGHTFIIVVMNSQDRFADTRALLSFIENNVSFVDLSISEEN